MKKYVVAYFTNYEELNYKVLSAESDFQLYHILKEEVGDMNNVEYFSQIKYVSKWEMYAERIKQYVKDNISLDLDENAFAFICGNKYPKNNVYVIVNFLWSCNRERIIRNFYKNYPETTQAIIAGANAEHVHQIHMKEKELKKFEEKS